MKIAIIGAGIAGLTLRKELKLSGIEVDVFEKSRGLGGRLANKRTEWGNLDIGAQYFTARDPRFVSQVEQWQAQEAAATWPFTPYQLSDSELLPSPDDTQRYVGTPAMNSLAHALCGDCAVKFKTHIHKIEQKNQKWYLHSTDGEQFGLYDWLVVTAPADQCAKLLEGFAVGKTIPKGLHHPCWALALATRGNVATKIQGIFGDEVISWASRLSARPMREPSRKFDDLWMLHFSSEWSQKNGKDTPMDIAKIGFDWLNVTLTKHSSESLQLMHSHHHFWRYARINPKKPPHDLCLDTKNRVATIGDWSHGGRVEGAYLSALDLAERIISTTKKRLGK